MVLAVDGGNTKTIAVVADETGRALGGGRGGCADIYNAAAPQAAIEAIAAAVEPAQAVAGASAADVEAATFSLAGANRGSQDTTLTAAAAVLVALPVMIVYVFLQRSFIRGMFAGAVKE